MLLSEAIRNGEKAVCPRCSETRMVYEMMVHLRVVHHFANDNLAEWLADWVAKQEDRHQTAPEGEEGK